MFLALHRLISLVSLFIEWPDWQRCLLQHGSHLGAEVYKAGSVLCTCAADSARCSGDSQRCQLSPVSPTSLLSKPDQRQSSTL